MASGISVKLPLTVSVRDGAYNLNQTIKESVAQNIKTIILTNPGERIMDINFGVGIKRYLFEPLTDVSKEAIRNRVLTQISTYIPTVVIENLDIQSSEDANYLRVRLEYTFPGVNAVQILNMGIK